VECILLNPVPVAHKEMVLVGAMVTVNGSEGYALLKWLIHWLEMVSVMTEPTMLAVYLMVVIAVGVVSIWIIAQNVNVSALNMKMEYLMDWLKIMFAMME
jgi:hypothetical protein